MAREMGDIQRETQQISSLPPEGATNKGEEWNPTMKSIKSTSDVNGSCALRPTKSFELVEEMGKEEDLTSL
jgi:hypothetical protein